MEVDGPEGTYLDGHTLRNGSIKGATDTELADFRDGARGTFENIYFFNFSNPSVAGRGDLSLSGVDSGDNFANNILNFSNLEVTSEVGVILSDVFKGGTDARATEVALGANTVGADKASFEITGHTDRTGSAAYNKKLSKIRANSVKKELVNFGVEDKDIQIDWKGESEPLIDTADQIKEPQNRRAEIKLHTETIEIQ